MLLLLQGSDWAVRAVLNIKVYMPPYMPKCATQPTREPLLAKDYLVPREYGTAYLTCRAVHVPDF